MDEKNPEMDERKLRDMFRQAVERGAIESILHFDAHGTKRDAVENAMIDMISRMNRELGVLYCKGEIDQAIENNDLYSCAAEVKLLTANYNALVNIAIKYAPIAVEVRAPGEVKLTAEEAQINILDIAQASQDFAKVFFEKIMPKEDFAKFNEQMENRAKLGEILRNKAAAEKKKD